RLQHHVSVRTRRPRRLCRQSRTRIAAPRPFPSRIRRQDLAREFGPATPREPLLYNAGVLTIRQTSGATTHLHKNRASGSGSRTTRQSVSRIIVARSAFL